MITITRLMKYYRHCLFSLSYKIFFRYVQGEVGQENPAYVSRMSRSLSGGDSLQQLENDDSEELQAGEDTGSASIDTWVSHDRDDMLA